MKKFYAIVAFAFAALTASAQQTVTLSTYLGSDIAKFAGQTRNVSINRYIFNGWNTISLPVNMTSEEVKEAFGSDCKLEKFVGVEKAGSQINMQFQDALSEGLQANVPYILHYTGETKNIHLTLEGREILTGESSVSYTIEGTNSTVTFTGAQKQTSAKNHYGILAKDNGEASFVNVDDIANGFFATRCFVTVNGITNASLNTIHVGDATAITSVMANSSDRADVYNVSGSLVKSNASMSEINNLQKGIYVVNGKKILVK